MSHLKNIFHQPTIIPIGGIDFTVSKIAFDHFDDALTLGDWLNTLDEKILSIEQLNTIKTGTPERAALDRLLSGCLAIPHKTELAGAQGQHDEPIQLQPSDIESMPIPMVAEAVAVVLEVNADFFFQTLPKLLQVANRIKSTGSELHSSLSAQVTT